MDNSKVKYYIISGGSSGLGYNLANELLKIGYGVIILGTNKKRLRISKTNLQKENNNILCLKCDINNIRHLKKLKRFILSKDINLCGLINNAGKGYFCDIKNIDIKIVNDILDTNLKGMILLTSTILSMVPNNKEFKIINIMSTAALEPKRRETIYCLSKWGQRGFTESLRLEVNKNIKVIAVYPGGMKTPFWEKIDTQKDISHFMDPVNVAKRIINSEENNIIIKRESIQ